MDQEKGSEKGTSSGLDTQPTQPPPYDQPSQQHASPQPQTQPPQQGALPQQYHSGPLGPGNPPVRGYPPGPAYPPGPGYPPTGPLYAGALSNLAQNLPQTQPNWMPIPTENAPPGCPPGLEYLTQIDQILVHQQIELFELFTGYETENKYRIRNTLGQDVYFAAEKSSPFQRQCCGPGREFSMSIMDNSQREVVHLERPLRCYCNCNGLTCYCCCSCCAPHEIEVQCPPGTVVGYVKQEPFGIIRPWFSIQDADEQTVLRMKGPFLGCSCYSDANFEVLSADGTQSVGRISKQWGGLAKEYFTDADNFGIQFPMDLDVKMKAVMLGAVFLIDFMFFERPGQHRGGHHRHRY